MLSSDNMAELADSVHPSTLNMKKKTPYWKYDKYVFFNTYPNSKERKKGKYQVLEIKRKLKDL